MIRSMTGFGRAFFEVEGVTLAVEIRTVNHRHRDVSVRVPRLLSAVESGVKRQLEGWFARGKVVASVSLAPSGAGPATLELDRDLARQYLAFAEDLRRSEGATGELDVASLLALPGVSRFVERDLPEAALGAALRRAVDEAAAGADTMRTAEGEALETELRLRLGAVATLVDALAGRAESVVLAAKERLRKRSEQIREVTGLLDEARLHQEIVIAADRLDVTEEVVRLRSHLEQFGSALDGAAAGSPVGRRLDFLLQEMGREANTLGSKGGDAGFAGRVVDLKTELERIREQVQNVE